MESTFMRYGIGKSDIIKTMLKPETMKTWTLSLHVRGNLLQDLFVNQENTSHISADKTNRKGIGGKFRARF